METQSKSIEDVIKDLEKEIRDNRVEMEKYACEADYATAEHLNSVNDTLYHVIRILNRKIAVL